jgi:hypothetical protein
MTEIVGYQLVISNDPSTVVQSWGGTYGQCPEIPNPLTLPNGDQIASPQLRQDYAGWMLMPWSMDGPSSALLDGTVFIALLTDAEYVAIQAACQTNATIGRWWNAMTMTNHVDVADVASQAAAAAMVAAKAITAERSAVLFPPAK